MAPQLPDGLENELTYTTAKSGGKGGQHVNKVSTKVWVRFDLAGTALFDTEQKERIAVRLAKRINKDGIISLSADAERSQLLNKKRVTEKLLKLLEKALEKPKKRKKRKVPKAVIENRLKNKKRKGEIKRQRSRKFDED